MKKWKQKIAMALVLAILVTLIPVGNVQAKSKSPAKLGAKDFVYTWGGKKTDFLKVSKNDEGYHNFYCEIIDTKNLKDTGKSIKTNRKVKTGSTESYVKEQYGETSKVKVSKNERYYKYMKYTFPGIDISAWKSYLEYAYQKGSDKYKIRFYLDKKSKVTAIIYIKNLNKFYNYPNKELNPQLTFQAPKGKKVTTKTINGKKVYMIPRGTKINFKKGAVSKSVFNRTIMSISMYDVYGNQKGGYDGDSFWLDGHPIKQGESFDIESLMDGTMYTSDGTYKKINIKKPGKYLYFAIKCDDVRYDAGNYKRSKAPAIYYFKFK